MDLSKLNSSGGVPIGGIIRYANYMADIIENDLGQFIKAGHFITGAGWHESLDMYAPFNAWQQKLPANNISNLHASSAGTWIVAGNRNSILRSTDNGNTFTEVSVPLAVDIKGITTDNAGTWLAIDDTGAGTQFGPRASTDDGLTWAGTSTAGGATFGAIDNDKNGVWIYGVANNIKRATADLTNAAAAPSVFTTGGNCKAIKYGRDGIWLAGSTTNRSVYRSVNNGLNWSLVANVGSSTDIFDIGFNGDQFWVVLASARLIVSSDNGATWSSEITLPGTISSGKVIHLGGTEWLIVHNNGTWYTSDNFNSIEIKYFTGTGFLDTHLNNGKLISIKSAGVGLGEHIDAIGLSSSGLTEFDYMRFI